MTELRRRMIQDMQLRGLTPGTQDTYLKGVKALARHYGRSPDQLTEEQIRQFFLHLTQTRRLARSTVRVYLYAIKFLYRFTLKRSWPVFELVRVPKSKKLPVVLSPDEVGQLLTHTRRPDACMVAVLLYSCGLRISEAVKLQAKHIDSKRSVVCVRNGKGNKDRYVPLPKRTLELLRAYWSEHRPPAWLFPASDGDRPIGGGGVRACIKAAAAECGINKTVGCHTLRHTYATHLLEQGFDLRVIAGFLGHSNLQTTARYAHLTQRAIESVRARIDGLMADL